MPQSNSQIDRLGERLRQAEEIDPADLDVLEEVLAGYQRPMSLVQEAITRILPDIEPTARLKTSETINEKLRRIHVRLTQMEDIAGVRIVRRMDRTEQDQIVARLLTVLPDSRIVDRRLHPSHGYRAVHVVVQVDGKLVEVQVRTHYQDVWAQVVEKLGDLWGRQIRYGEPPQDPDASIGTLKDGHVVSRAEFWGVVLNASDAFNGIETAAVDLRQAEEHARVAEGPSDGSILAEVERLRAAKRQLEDAAETLAKGLPELADLLGGTIAP